MCAINVSLVQLQDTHDMQENVSLSNLQLVLFADYLFKEETSEF